MLIWTVSFYEKGKHLKYTSGLAKTLTVFCFWLLHLVSWQPPLSLLKVPKPLIIHWNVQGGKIHFLNTFISILYHSGIIFFFKEKKVASLKSQNDHFLKVLLFPVKFSWFLFSVYLSPQVLGEGLGQLWGTLSVKPESGGLIACDQEFSLLHLR